MCFPYCKKKPKIPKKNEPTEIRFPLRINRKRRTRRTAIFRAITSSSYLVDNLVRAHSCVSSRRAAQRHSYRIRDLEALVITEKHVCVCASVRACIILAPTKRAERRTPLPFALLPLFGKNSYRPNRAQFLHAFKSY